MVIYVDIFSFGNFIVNLFLLYVLAKCMGIKLDYKKCILSSSLGTCYALLVLYTSFNVVLSNLFIKLLTSFFMVVIVVGYKDLMQLIKANLIFLSLTFLLAGLCIFIEINGLNIINVFSFVVSSKTILTGIMIFVLLLDRLYYFLKEWISNTNYIFEVEINMLNKSIKINSFLDTGNELKEPITNLPVVLLERNIIDVKDLSENEIYLIPYTAADGTRGTMKAFKPEKFAINKNGNFIEKEVIIAITDANFSEKNDYKALLNKILLI